MLYGCPEKPYVVKSLGTISGVGSHVVYVVNHGWHTGFVVRIKDIQKKIPVLNNRFGSSQYIEFGWGDKAFYQAEEITSSLALRAILWPTESVIHAVAVPEIKGIYLSNSEVAVLCLDNNQYAQLISFIEHSFYKDNNGNIIKLKSEINGNSQFYKGEGDYYLTNTCNKWTAKGLKSAGFDISPVFKLTADSIMSFLAKQDKSLTKRSCATQNINESLSTPQLYR